MPIGINCIVFVLVLMISTGIHAARAFSSDGGHCTNHFSDGTWRDPHVDDLRERVGAGGAVRFCPAHKNRDEDWYYLLSPISKQNGVLFYYQTQIFLVENTGVMVWDYTPPKHLRERLGTWFIRSTYMCPEEFSCERHNGIGFTLTEGLSPYLFRKLQDVWAKMTESEAAFYHAASASKYDVTTSRSFKSARSYIFSQQRKRVKIDWVYFKDTEFREILKGGKTSTVPPRFEFSFGERRGRHWGMSFDFSDSGIEIMHITESIE